MGNEIPFTENELVNNNSSDIDMASEQEEPINKVVYIKLNLCFNEEDSKDYKHITSGIVKRVVLTPELSCKNVRKLLLSTFGFQDSTLVLKLRNQRGSVIPLSYSLNSNYESRPYLLEVCHRYQNVKAFERTVSLPTYEQLLKRKLESILNRLTKLEDFVPSLPQKQHVKVEEEIHDLNEKMNVLDRKLKDADENQWQGMFKRNPLW